MKKPTRADFGWTRQHGWKSVEDIDRWSDALCAWENYPRNPGGRPRTRPIHESWNEALKLFNPNDPTRSQRAFCEWAGIKPASFSTWQTKPLLSHVELWIREWHWIGDGEGLDGSINTNQDRVKKEAENG